MNPFHVIQHPYLTSIDGGTKNSVIDPLFLPNENNFKEGEDVAYKGIVTKLVHVDPFDPRTNNTFRFLIKWNKGFKGEKAGLDIRGKLVPNQDYFWVTEKDLEKVTKSDPLSEVPNKDVSVGKPYSKPDPGPGYEMKEAERLFPPGTRFESMTMIGKIYTVASPFKCVRSKYNAIYVSAEREGRSFMKPIFRYGKWAKIVENKPSATLPSAGDYWYPNVVKEIEKESNQGALQAMMAGGRKYYEGSNFPYTNLGKFIPTKPERNKYIAAIEPELKAAGRVYYEGINPISKEVYEEAVKKYIEGVDEYSWNIMDRKRDPYDQSPLHLMPKEKKLLTIII
jgi:hypothetical protein